jgi:hypothetical protein
MLQAIRIMISMKKHIVTTRLPEVGLAYDWQLYRTPRLSSQTNTYPQRLSHTLTDYPFCALYPHSCTMIMISTKKHTVTTRLREAGLAYAWQLSS